MNKKSLFFSLLSVFIVLIFYLSFRITAQYAILESEMASTRTRVEVLNSIINDLDERYIERLLYVSAKSALGAMSRYASVYSGTDDGLYWVSGKFKGYKDLKNELNKTMTEGELIHGVNLKEDPLINTEFSLNKNNLIWMTEHLKNKFDAIGIDIDTFEIKIISLKQTDPLTLDIGADINYYFKDKNKIASWKGETHKEIEINILGMYDPKHKKRIRDFGTTFLYDDFSDSGLPACGGDILADPDCGLSSPVNGCNCIHEQSFLNKLIAPGSPTEKDKGLGICFEDGIPETPNCETPI
ncbi:hypothetical protein JXB41_08775 [Candidatus Woesearchaeota archaeon]|nr:hypothetical protein [Candidatus Woesearchaeota archaeon]